jgi:hypothetical protein
VYLTDDISEGDLVAARTPDGLLIKYISYLPNGFISLYDSTTRYRSPRAYPAKLIRIDGRVVGKE